MIITDIGLAAPGDLAATDEGGAGGRFSRSTTAFSVASIRTSLCSSCLRSAIHASIMASVRWPGCRYSCTMFSSSSTAVPLAAWPSRISSAASHGAGSLNQWSTPRVTAPSSLARTAWPPPTPTEGNLVTHCIDEVLERQPVAGEGHA